MDRLQKVAYHIGVAGDAFAVAQANASGIQSEQQMVVIIRDRANGRIASVFAAGTRRVFGGGESCPVRGTFTATVRSSLVSQAFQTVPNAPVPS